jgi:hypothetical protein
MYRVPVGLGFLSERVRNYSVMKCLKAGVEE